MPSMYCCTCYAVPAKMLRVLSEDASEANRKAMRAHIETAARFRAGRHDVTALPAPARGSRKMGAADGRLEVYDAQGQAELPGKLVRGDGAPPVRDKAVNEACENAQITLDFYRTVFKRDSIDGRGMPLLSSVHVAVDFPNGMWTGTQMAYGDGNEEIRGFTAALDIVAHEITHGVTQHLTPRGLGVVKMPASERQFEFEKYKLEGQGGALNESISDVFASMAKQWHLKQTVQKADWLMGDGLLARGQGAAIRSLQDPGNRLLTWYEDDQVSKMADYVEGGDVHDNSGIPNHAFYLAAMALGGSSWETVGPVWYGAIQKLKANAGFRDMAKATLKIASEQSGGARLAKAIAWAWQQVGVLKN